MIYSVNKTNYHNFNISEINKLPPRAYFIPYSSFDKLNSVSLKDERYLSDKVQLLNGEWDFKYFPKVSEMPDEIDTSSASFDKITVPSTWQRTGYENPWYLNFRYPFMCDDNSVYPSIPKDVSCGIYRKKINISSEDKNYIITFLGVISSLDLYINGKFVGYSEGAHNSAEFDITKYITEGENELFCVVYRWSNATYLECQDMFRENGIFRDVYITECEKSYIFDCFNRYRKTAENTYEIITEIKLCGDTDGCEATAEIFFDGKKLISKSKTVKKSDRSVTALICSLSDVIEWSAEKPMLYDIFVSLKNDGKLLETERFKTGFKNIEIKKNIYYFNSKPIKFKGVNHHDSHPVTGYVMSPDDIIKDIELMKEYNVNAVRTSHYPPDPFFLTMCDVYGLYVIDEADIETHGCELFLGKDNLISDDLRWANRYCDRTARMYYRDRNHASIAMWSLGNESSGHLCQDAACGIIKSDSDIPVHYEGVCIQSRGAYDVFSNMYPPIATLKDRRLGLNADEHPFFEYKNNKPYFMCEYAHSMGIGPGELEDYWEEIYKSDILMGGCIWEWCDHANTHFNKNLKYTYGGDHGEKFHDGNFCVDALFYPDRTPHTGALEMKTVYRPVRCTYIGNNKFVFRNTNYFTDTDNIDIKWELLENGRTIKSGSLDLNIEPCSSKEIELQFEICDGKEYHINFTYERNSFELAKEQCVICEISNNFKLLSDKKAQVKGSTVICENGEVVFDESTGEMVSYNFDGTEYVSPVPYSQNKGFYPNIFRAFHDNDVFLNKPFFERLVTKLDSFEIKETDFSAEAVSTYLICDGEKEMYRSEIVYSVFYSGETVISSKLKITNDEAERKIPRFGLTIEMKKEFGNIEYFGRGEKENLSDFNVHAPVGIYTSDVENENEPYIYPQENGYHSEVRYLKIFNSENRGVIIENTGRNFTFNIHDYTSKALYSAKHQEEIVKSGTAVLNIDGFTCGTGSNSCGPVMNEKYLLNIEDELEFSFVIIPIK